MLVVSTLALPLFSAVFGSGVSHFSISLKEIRMSPFFNMANKKLILKVAYCDLWVINTVLLYPF